MLCNLAVRLERLEDYVVQFNHDVSVWTEFETGLALTLQDDMANYKVPYGTVRQIDNKLSNYIAYNEGKRVKVKAMTIILFNLLLKETTRYYLTPYNPPPPLIGWRYKSYKEKL